MIVACIVSSFKIISANKFVALINSIISRLCFCINCKTGNNVLSL